MRIIKQEEHSEKWSKGFEKETHKISSIFSENIIGTYHIGSTAIIGLLAKPVIDILLEVTSLRKL